MELLLLLPITDLLCALLHNLSERAARKSYLAVRWDPSAIRNDWPRFEGCYTRCPRFKRRGLWLLSQWEGCETFPRYLPRNYSLRKHEGGGEARGAQSNLKAPSPTKCCWWWRFQTSRLVDFQPERHVMSILFWIVDTRALSLRTEALIGLPGGGMAMMWNDNICSRIFSPM